MTDHPAADGPALLDAIERSLREWLDRAVEPPAEPAADVPPPALQALDERLARWQECLQRAEAAAADADRPLAEAQAVYQEWLGRLRAAREKLAPRLGGGGRP